jgi:hypothetical protein
MSVSTESLALRAQAEGIADLYRRETHIGAPSLLADPNTIHTLLAAVQDGNYVETACKLAGISKASYYNLKKRAESGDEPAMAFVDALEKAEALAESQMVGCVSKAAQAGPQFWAAGMTLLERRHPERFGKRSDDSNAPKVIVQIGIRDSDITISGLSPQVT